MGISPSQPCDSRSTVNRLATKLLQQVSAADGKENKGESKSKGSSSSKNVLLSPLSIYLALSMAWSGASKQTRLELGLLLGLSTEGDKADGLKAVQALAHQVSRNGGGWLQMANSMWCNDLSSDFKSSCLKHMQADARPIGSAAEVNAWVAGKTNNKIQQVLAEDPEDSGALLINAVLFKAPWEEAFKKEDVVQAFFNKQDDDAFGKPHPVDLMFKRGSMLYAETEIAQMVQCPYKGGEFSALFILPRADSSETLYVPSRYMGALRAFAGIKGRASSIDELVQTADWNTWLEMMQPCLGSLHVPKFKFEDQYELVEACQALGVREAFLEKKADFSEMSSTRRYIHGIKHKTFVDVNEEGTEAAGVTLVDMRVECVSVRREESPVPRFIMRCDRSFAVAIVHNKTKALAFVGLVRNI